MRIFVRLLNMYKNQVDKRPLLTQVLTAGTMTTVCDVLTQRLIERNQFHDYRRTAIMGSCGFLYFGPLCATWLTILNKSKLPVIACVVLDQGFFVAPLLSGFLGIQSVLSGKTLSAARDRIKSDLLPILKVNWLIWIPAQAFNFYAVPFQFRMMFLQVVALFWNCYLSNEANKTTEME